MRAKLDVVTVSPRASGAIFHLALCEAEAARILPKAPARWKQAVWPPPQLTGSSIRGSILRDNLPIDDMGECRGTHEGAGAVWTWRERPFGRRSASPARYGTSASTCWSPMDSTGVQKSDPPMAPTSATWPCHLAARRPPPPSIRPCSSKNRSIFP